MKNVILVLFISLFAGVTNHLFSQDVKYNTDMSIPNIKIPFDSLIKKLPNILIPFDTLTWIGPGMSKPIGKQNKQILNVGDIVEGEFYMSKNNSTPKSYFAEVTVVDNNGDFTCRMVHTNSIYKFKFKKIERVDGSDVEDSDLKYADFYYYTVEYTKGGSYPKGSSYAWSMIYRKSPILDCSVPYSGYSKRFVTVTFSDGKSFVAEIVSGEIDNKEFTVKFLHSGNQYRLGQGKVLSSQGSYKKGTKYTAVCAYPNPHWVFKK